MNDSGRTDQVWDVSQDIVNAGGRLIRHSCGKGDEVDKVTGEKYGREVL